MSIELEELCREFVAKRTAGKTTARIQPLTDDDRKTPFEKKINDFVGSIGFRKLEKGWKEISKKQARAVLTKYLTVDLAYGGRLRKIGDVEGRVERFLSAFGEKARYFTNGDYYLRSPTHSWSQISDATFETGVVAFGNSLIGIVWVQDED